MKKDNNQAKHNRGSSAPFPYADQGLHGLEIGLNSINQYSDESPYVQFYDQHADQEKELDDQESDARRRKDMRTGQDLFDDTEFRKNQDDENRWQDDGGESGETI
jgi:hypothetical protein